jgi:hypothetical protein
MDEVWQAPLLAGVDIRTFGPDERRPMRREFVHDT